MSDVLAVAEHRRGELRDVSREAITAGRALADAIGGDLHVAVVGGDVEAHAEGLNREGVDAIHAVTHGEEFNHDVYTQAVTRLAESLAPSATLVPHTVNGMDYAPAVANRLGVPIVTDAVGLEGDGSRLSVTREMYGSKVETRLDLDLPALVTVRPGEWPPASGSGGATVETFDARIDESAIRSAVKGFQEVGSGEVDITEADVIVAVGRGIGEEENLELIFDLAEALGGTVAGSRPLIDNGWLPKGRQVGQSGKTVRPDVYLAIGISGAVQHVTGMTESETIVAVNTDPNAPIFDVADYGVVGDLFDVVPELVAAFE